MLQYWICFIALIFSLPQESKAHEPIKRQAIPVALIQSDALVTAEHKPTFDNRNDTNSTGTSHNYADELRQALFGTDHTANVTQHTTHEREDLWKENKTIHIPHAVKHYHAEPTIAIHLPKNNSKTFNHTISIPRHHGAVIQPALQQLPTGAVNLFPSKQTVIWSSPTVKVKWTKNLNKTSIASESLPVILIAKKNDTTAKQNTSVLDLSSKAKDGKDIKILRHGLLYLRKDNASTVTNLSDAGKYTGYAIRRITLHVSPHERNTYTLTKLTIKGDSDKRKDPDSEQEHHAVIVGPLDSLPENPDGNGPQDKKDKDLNGFDKVHVNRESEKKKLDKQQAQALQRNKRQDDSENSDEYNTRPFIWKQGASLRDAWPREQSTERTVRSNLKGQPSNNFMTPGYGQFLEEESEIDIQPQPGRFSYTDEEPLQPTIGKQINEQLLEQENPLASDISLRSILNEPLESSMGSPEQSKAMDDSSKYSFARNEDLLPDASSEESSETRQLSSDANSLRQENSQNALQRSPYDTSSYENQAGYQQLVQESLAGDANKEFDGASVGQRMDVSGGEEGKHSSPGRSDPVAQYLPSESRDAQRFEEQNDEGSKSLFYEKRDAQEMPDDPFDSGLRAREEFMNSLEDETRMPPPLPQASNTEAMINPMSPESTMNFMPPDLGTKSDFQSEYMPPLFHDSPSAERMVNPMEPESLMNSRPPDFGYASDFRSENMGAEQGLFNRQPVERQLNVFAAMSPQHLFRARGAVGRLYVPSGNDDNSQHISYGPAENPGDPGKLFNQQNEPTEFAPYQYSALNREHPNGLRFVNPDVMANAMMDSTKSQSDKYSAYRNFNYNDLNNLRSQFPTEREQDIDPSRFAAKENMLPFLAYSRSFLPSPSRELADESFGFPSKISRSEIRGQGTYEDRQGPWLTSAQNPDDQASYTSRFGAEQPPQMLAPYEQQPPSQDSVSNSGTPENRQAWTNPSFQAAEKDFSAKPESFLTNAQGVAMLVITTPVNINAVEATDSRNAAPKETIEHTVLTDDGLTRSQSKKQVDDDESSLRKAAKLVLQDALNAGNITSSQFESIQARLSQALNQRNNSLLAVRTDRSKVPVACKDTISSCQKFKDAGVCPFITSFMANMCPKTCQKCYNDSANLGEEPSNHRGSHKDSSNKDIRKMLAAATQKSSFDSENLFDSDPPAPPNPVMSLGFESEVDGVIKDRSKNGNDAMLENGAKISAKELGSCGRAAELNEGSITWNGASFKPIPEEAITIAMWVKVKKGGIINWFANGEKGETRTFFSRTKGAIVPAKVWTHVAGTYDSETGLCRIYVNGELSEENRQKKGRMLSRSWLVSGIGSSFGDDSIHYVDEVYIYDRALPPREVRLLYNRCTFNRMILHFGFQKGNATYIKDQSGLENDGILVGGAVTQNECDRCGACLDLTSGPDPSMKIQRISKHYLPRTRVSLSVWVSLNETSGTHDVFLTESSTGNVGYRLQVLNGRVRWSIGTDNKGVIFDNTTKDQVVPEALWTHIAATYNSLSGAVAVYSNGILKLNVTVPEARRFDLPSDWENEASIGNKNFHGFLDECIMYNWDLDQAEVVYVRGYCADHPKLVRFIVRVPLTRRQSVPKTSADGT